jgi:hypothetical protein
MSAPRPPAALRGRAARPGTAALVLLAAGLAGCHPRVPPPDLSRDPADLLGQVQAAQARVQSVRGEARTGVESPSGGGTTSQFIAAARPDRLHVEVLDFFGNVVAVLSAADGRFGLYDAQARVFYRGTASPAHLARLVPLPLPAEDLVAILCGTAPLLPGGAPVDAAPGDGVVNLTLRAGDRTQRLSVSGGAAVERAELRTAGAPAPGDYDVELDSFRKVDGGWFPFKVALRAQSPTVKIDLRWTDVEVNAPLEAALFHVEPPRGARVVELGDEDPGPVDLFRLAPAGSPPPGGPAGAGPGARE